MLYRIKKGLDIPLPGAPQQVIEAGAPVTSVAVLGADYLGLRPRLEVREGESVRLGQPLFSDRRHPAIRFTSPGCGTVTAIQRGARRALQSVVVRLTGDAEERFTVYAPDRLARLRHEQVTANLLLSGLWTALRTRPYSKVPDPSTVPHSIFVTAMDSSPLAARAEVILDAYWQDFAHGLTVVAHLTEGQVFVCAAPGANIPVGASANIAVATFAGPHPAGLVGTHIHFLDPVSAGRTVWHLSYQDVIAIGKLFTTGRLWVERIVALAGPVVQRPRLIRTRLGANIDELVLGALHEVPRRVLSGSVLSGRQATGPAPYLGRFHQQVSVIAEGRAPAGRSSGHGLSALINACVAVLARRRESRLTTALHGERQAMVPLGTFERLMPLDMLPTQLLRALLVGDTEMAQALGCLELDEEDLALCTFVCPSKHDYGPLLRACLTQLEKEG